MEHSIHLRIQGDKETFFLREVGVPNSEIPITLSSDRLGYALCQILDLDGGSVSDVLRRYVGIGSISATVELLIKDHVYDTLNRLSDIYKLYTPETYGEPIFHHYYFRYSVDRFRCYVDYHDCKQMKYDYGFFSFLLVNGYFGTMLVDDSSNILLEPYNYFSSCLSDPQKRDDIEAHYAYYSGHSPNQQVDSVREYDITTGNRLALVALITLKELILRKRIVRKCLICRNHFVAENRIDTLYCDNPCPQDSTMSCKKYAKYKLWYDRQQDDELAKLSRNILSAKGMLAKRNPDIPAYQRSYEYFRRKRLKWMEDVKSGKATREEYREWLLRMKEQKTIKETSDGND